jgi:hypothetical protein
MREPHIEGVATRDDPESCVGAREGVGEALTGARMGTVLSREIRFCWDADAVIRGGRQHCRHRYREVPSDPARSKTRGTCGTSLCENREIPCLPADDGGGSRREVRRT